MSCSAPPDAFLEARLSGAVEVALSWRAPDMDCDGMRRPDGQGLRVTFSGAAGGERLTLVFAAPRLAEGAAGRAVPVNVTLIREGGAMYSTRGEDKCVLDEVRQQALEPPPAGAAPALADAPAPRRWRIEARGFCLEPARAVGDGRDAILLATFDFRGQLTWEPDPAPPPPPAAPAAQPEG
jgi:hypothetical protein